MAAPLRPIGRASVRTRERGDPRQVPRPPARSRHEDCAREWGPQTPQPRLAALQGAQRREGLGPPRGACGSGAFPGEAATCGPHHAF